MPSKADFDAVMDEIDTETNNLAAVVDGLRNEVKAGMTPAEESSVKDRMANLRDRLKTIGADPDNPVPNPTPTP
jgi:outer membrane murein-binding lipoprotein Lpp